MGNDIPGAKDNAPLEFEDFKNGIDTRGGYLTAIDHVQSFMINMDDNRLRTEGESGYIEPIDASINWECLGLPKVPNETTCFVSSIMLPDISLKLNNETREAYEEGRCTETAKSQDTQLERIKQWLEDLHG